MEAKGKSSVISTSKIKKITAIKKKRREKGKRADPLGSNPHSKGEFFSRSIIVFLAKIDDNSITTVLIIKINKVEKDAKIIIFSEVRPTDWKSVILIYTKKIRLSSSPVDRNIKEKSNNINKMSVSSGSFKS